MRGGLGPCNSVGRRVGVWLKRKERVVVSAVRVVVLRGGGSVGFDIGVSVSVGVCISRGIAGTSL
jgi:hypothetical protein